MKQLPSAHQFGDAVDLSFGDAGTIKQAKITKVSFDPGKVFYDAEIEVKQGMKTRLRMIDSAFVENAMQRYAFKVEFSVDSGKGVVGKPNDTNRAVFQYFHKMRNYAMYLSYREANIDIETSINIKYLGYNPFNDYGVFETREKLNDDAYFIRIPLVHIHFKNGYEADVADALKDKTSIIKFYKISDIEPPSDIEIAALQPTTVKSNAPTNSLGWTDNEILWDIKIQNDLKSVMTPAPDAGTVGYDPLEDDDLLRFSIKDIDKVFDDERKHHGSNPLDSINRMYRKLLALKEKKV